MRTFYTGSDIEDLAASGIRQLELTPGVALTDVARERAEELGIVLLTAGSAPASKAAAPPASPAPAQVSVSVATARGESLPTRPRGCQHAPLAASASRATSAGSGGAMVEQLVEAVNALKTRGG